MHACMRSVAGVEYVRIKVSGKSRGATRKRRKRLVDGVGEIVQQRRCLLAPFDAALTNTEAPVLHLEYDQWSSISSEHALPPSAQVDWVRGRARAPQSWELELQSSQFVFDLPTLGTTASFRLEDVQPDMTVARSCSFSASDCLGC